MRGPADKAKIETVLRALGERATGGGKIYLVGGTSVVLEGGRDSTIDLDLKLDPEPAGVFEAIAHIKNEFDVNVELASPDQFIPELPNWRERSPFIARHGQVDFHHYDFYSQALAKLSRAQSRDLLDIEYWANNGRIDRDQLWDYFTLIQPKLIRYPNIDPSALNSRIKAFVASNR